MSTSSEHRVVVPDVKVGAYEITVGRPRWVVGPLGWLARWTRWDQAWTARGATVAGLFVDLQRLAMRQGFRIEVEDDGSWLAIFGPHQVVRLSFDQSGASS